MRAEFRAGLDALEDRHIAAGFVPLTVNITANHERDHAGHIRDWRRRF